MVELLLRMRLWGLPLVARLVLLALVVAVSLIHRPAFQPSAVVGVMHGRPSRWRRVVGPGLVHGNGWGSGGHAGRRRGSCCGSCCGSMGRRLAAGRCYGAVDVARACGVTHGR